MDQGGTAEIFSSVTRAHSPAYQLPFSQRAWAPAFQLYPLVLVVLFTAALLSGCQASESGLAPGNVPPKLELADLQAALDETQIFHK